MFMRKTLVTALVGAASLAVLSTTARADDRNDGCSEASLRGAFPFSADGVLVVGSEAGVGGQPVPTAAVGVVELDGKGGCIDEANVNVGGARTPVKTSGGFGDNCTYVVENDCTGDLTVTFEVLDDDGNPTGVTFGPFVTPLRVVNTHNFRFTVAVESPFQVEKNSFVNGAVGLGDAVKRNVGDDD